MFSGILNQTQVANSHSAFSQRLCWFSEKWVFDPKVLKRPIQNNPRKGPIFGKMGWVSKTEKAETNKQTEEARCIKQNKTKQK